MTPNKHRTPAIRPSRLANDIDRAFGCVADARLNDILTHYRFPEHIVWTKADFNLGRTIFLAFDGKQETPIPFQAGLSQGSPLSPILFVIYAAALTNPGPQPRLRQRTSYGDNKVMTQGTNIQKGAVRTLQKRLHARILRAEILNTGFAPERAELIPISPHKSRLLKDTDKNRSNAIWGKCPSKRMHQILESMDRQQTQLQGPGHSCQSHNLTGRGILEAHHQPKGSQARRPTPPSQHNKHPRNAVGIRSRVDGRPTRPSTHPTGLPHHCQGYHRPPKMDNNTKPPAGIQSRHWTSYSTRPRSHMAYNYS